MRLHSAHDTMGEIFRLAGVSANQSMADESQPAPAYVPDSTEARTAADDSRWPISLVDLFSAITLIAVLLGLTHWFSRGFATDRTYQTSLRVGLPSGATLVVCAISYWHARWRGGGLLYWLRLRTTLARWKVLMWIPFAAGVAIYIAMTLMDDSRDAAPTALVLMWVFGTGSVVNLLFGSLRLQENGIVRTGLIWFLSPWPRCRELRFHFDENGDLVAGHSWSRIVACVPLGQHATIAAILNRQMGLGVAPPIDDGKDSLAERAGHSDGNEPGA